MIKTAGIKEFFYKNNLSKKLVLGSIFISVFFILFYGFFILFYQNAVLYFSFAVGLVILLFLVFLLSTFYPNIFLLLALVSILNPYYLYLLYTHTWRYASLRVGISSFFILLLFITVFLRGSLRGTIQRFKTPLDTPLIAFLSFCAITTVYSFLLGNSFQLIFADLFPFLEFSAYFFIATILIKNLKQLNFILKGILAWLLLTSLGGIIFYFFSSHQLGYGAALGRIAVGRLADFMAAITLPLLAGLYFYVEPKARGLIIKQRLLIIFLSLIPLLSLLIGFFRSLWIGVGGALIFIFLMILKKKRHLKAVFTVLILITILFFSIDYFFISKTQIFRGKTLSSLLLERVLHEPSESSSIAGRFQQNPFLLSEIYKSPLIGKGFGTFSGFANFYLAIPYMMGLPALFFFFWLAFVFIKYSIQVFGNVQGIYKGWVLGILASFVSTALSVLFFPAILHFPIPAYLGVLAACLFLLPKFIKNLKNLEKYELP